MAQMAYTPQFIDFCERHYGKLNPLITLPGKKTTEIRPFDQAEATKMLLEVESCNEYQVSFLQEFMVKAKNDLDKHVIELERAKAFSAAKKKERDAYHQFFVELERKVDLAAKKGGQTPNAAQKPNSSFLPKPLQGQSLYDSMMHILGYDATTVGASAMFYLIFASLRFIVASPYWEQVAEYYAAPVSKRFKPDNLTNEQISLNLNENSTHEQIIQAGFLPPPHLGHAFEVEFKSFMQKLGVDVKQNTMEDRPNALGRGLLHPPRT